MKIEEAIKQNRFDSSHQKAIINIIYTANWIRDRQCELFVKHELLPQHYNILRILKGKHPGPSSPGQIKEVMLDKSNDITRLIDKLVKKGLAKRNLCETNRRKIDVFITVKGLSLLKEINEPFKKHISALKKIISVKEAENLSELLDKFRL
ncbi:MAG: MarR family winged helix-turn-helix transcriptional regulator [Bacteroidota bacterium]